ncbi:MAG: phosphopantothenoylcysteine decarboxylase [Victivallaceae bacterium]
MKKILISAGPTREKYDAVRFWSNRSSGKMGYALAAAAAARGWCVTLVSGPVALDAPAGVELVRVESAAEMAEAVKTRAPEMDAVIMAAAVADYRPVEPFAGKMKKMPGKLVIEFERTEDILASLGQVKRPGQTLVGFAAETDDLLVHAAGKLARKNLDWIVANDIGAAGRGFAVDTNAVTLLSSTGTQLELPLASKAEIAGKILDTIFGG